MLTGLLVLQIIITVSMVTVILLQRSSEDGMAGLAGGSGNSIMSGRASANLLTRITSVLATAFIINSLVMAAISSRSTLAEKSIIEEKAQQAEPSAPIADAPAKPEVKTDSVTPDSKDIAKKAAEQIKLIPAQKPQGALEQKTNTQSGEKTSKEDVKIPAKEENKPVAPVAK